MDNKCPKCGAADCGTILPRNVFQTHNGRVYVLIDCQDRQIAALEELVEELSFALYERQKEVLLADRVEDFLWRQLDMRDERLAAWRELKPHMEGWDAYGWKDGKYIPSIEDYFDDQMDKLRDLGELRHFP